MEDYQVSYIYVKNGQSGQTRNMRRIHASSENDAKNQIRNEHEGKGDRIIEFTKVKPW